MSPVAVSAVLAISVSIFLLTWLALAGAGQVRSRTVANLRLGLGSGDVESVETSTDDGGEHSLVLIARRLTPPALVGLLERLLVRAGRPPAWPLERLLVAKPALALGLGLMSLLVIGADPGILTVLLGIGVTIVGYFVPELLLYSRGVERSDKIGLELANTLDQMTIAVEAGLGFDSAMARAGRSGDGPLADELARTVQDIQVGQVRKEAYQSLVERNDVTDLRRFIRAINQADAYGIAVGDVLRTQAAEMRLKRRQRAEEQAQQIPVKVIFPLMVCILPVLFIVLLGPTAMDVMSVMGS